MVQSSTTDHILLRRPKSQARIIGVASAIWAGSIFLSRIMGLVREQIIGRTLGASREADLYFASFTLPDFLNYLLAAGALSIVFIPIFLEHLERGDEEGGWEAFSVIANFIVVAGGVGIALLMVFARPLAAVVAPGFTRPARSRYAGAADPDHPAGAVLPCDRRPVVGGAAGAGPALCCRRWRRWSIRLASSPAASSGALCRTWAPMDLPGACWPARCSGLRAAALWLPQDAACAGARSCRFRNADLRRYLWLSFPIMIGFSIVVVDEWIVKNQASYLGAGALSYLQYGRTLMKVPIGVFGMAAGVAAYPTISRMVAAGAVVEAYGVLCRAVRLMLVATFAAQVCLTLAGFEACLSDLGPVRQPVQRRRRAGYRHDSGLSLPRPWRLGGANSSSAAASTLWAAPGCRRSLGR